MVRPLSARNPRVQRLARLGRRREERAAERAFLVEGPVLVAAALAAGAAVTEVFVAADATDRPAVADVVSSLPPDVAAWELPPGVLDRIGDVTTSQGVIAVVSSVEATWPDPERAPFVVVLAELGDPGNAGTLIRTAAAAGAGAVVIAGGVDAFSPKVVRASAGAIFTIPVVEAATPLAAVSTLTSLGYGVHAASVREGRSVFEAPLEPPLAVVLGNEAHGLDPEVVAACADAITVPMAGATESLNVAMAGTVICFEVLRRGGAS